MIQEEGKRFRTKFIDYDARRTPKTSLYCVACQKDLDPQRPYRIVFLIGGEPFAVHPEDADVPGAESHAIGMDCARALGMEWTAEPGWEP